MARLPVGSYIEEDKKYKKFFKVVKPIISSSEMVKARQADQLKSIEPFLPKPSFRDRIRDFTQTVTEPVYRTGKGITRALPGGLTDLEVAEQASEQQAQDVKSIAERLKQKGLSAKQRARLKQLLIERAEGTENQALRDLSAQIQNETDKSAYLGAVAGTAGFFVPVAKGAQVLKGGIQATKAIGVSAGGGAIGGAGYTASANPEANIKDLAIGGGLGAIGGATSPLLGAAFNKVAGQTVSEFGKEVSKKLTPRQFVANKFANRISALRESDIKTAKAMVRRGEVKSKNEGLAKLRAEGRNLEQIANEYLASANKASLYFSGKTSGQVKNKESMLSLVTKSRERGTEELDNQFAIDMFDLEVRAKKGGVQLQPEATDVIEARVNSYKSANDSWQKELKIRKEYLDGLLDIDVKSGGIDKTTAKFIKDYYSTPVPINRLFDEDGLIRPEITGGVRNVGKDKIARYIEGGITEIDKTYVPYVDRALNAFKQDARNRLRAEIDTRVSRGELKGVQHVKAETTKARNKLQQSYNEFDKELKSINTLIRRQAANQRVAKARAVGTVKTQKAIVRGETRTNIAKAKEIAGKEKLRINAANRRLAKSTKKVINNVVATRRKSALADEVTANTMQFVDNVVNKMTQKELVRLSEGISGAKPIEEVRKSIAKSVARIEKVKSIGATKIARKRLTAEEKTLQVQKVVDETTAIVDALRSHREALKLGKRELREDISGLAENAPTHANVIKYLEDGDVTITEVDKGIMKSLENLESSTTAQEIIKFANIPSATLKAGWTSNPLLAPGFIAAKALFNPWLTVPVSRGKLRDLFNPLTIVEAIKPSFRRAIHERGAIAEGALSTARQPIVSVDQLVAGQIFKSPKAGITSIGKLLTSKEGLRATGAKLNTIGGTVDNAYRSWSAAATKRRFLRQYTKEGVNKGQATEQALKQAADDYNEVLGNLQRTTNTIRGLEAVLPYSQAGQAGVSAFARGIRERPGEVIPRLALTASVLGAGAYNFFRDPKAVEFVKEQYDAGRASQVDNSLYLPDPFGDGLKRVDDGDGKYHWEGVWKIRLPADFRPIMGMFNRGLYDNVTGENMLTDDFVYGAVAQLGMGGIGSDQKTTEFSPIKAFQQGSVGIIGNIIAGIDPDTGEKLGGWQGRAAAMSQELGQSVGWLTDYGNVFINDDGEFDLQKQNTGEFLAGALQRWGKGVKQIPRKMFIETAGVSDGSKIYRETQEALKGVKDTTLAQHQQLHAFDEDDNSAGLFYNSTRAQMLIDNPELFALEKKVALIRNKYNGKPIDPVFNVKYQDQRNAILSTQVTPTALRGQSNISSAVYDSKYYSDYQKARDKYYKDKAKWNKVMGYTSFADSDYPVPSKGVQKKLDYYYDLPTRLKKPYRIANPDVLAQLRAKQNWENERRQQYTNTTGVSLNLDNYYR